VLVGKNEENIRFHQSQLSVIPYKKQAFLYPDAYSELLQHYGPDIRCFFARYIQGL